MFAFILVALHIFVKQNETNMKNFSHLLLKVYVIYCKKLTFGV